MLLVEWKNAFIEKVSGRDRRLAGVELRVYNFAVCSRCVDVDVSLLIDAQLLSTCRHRRCPESQDIRGARSQFRHELPSLLACAQGLVVGTL